MTKTTYSRFLKSSAITMFAAGLALAQAPAGANRPATVPAGYVITPFGYFHTSCVLHLAPGDALNKNAIQHANGSIDNIQACAYPQYSAAGVEVAGPGGAQVAGGGEPTISHAWVEYASTITSTSFGYMNVYWNVPPAPGANNGQTVYLFPGMEDINHVVTIIQPVLGWNSDFASAWGIASWNCCTNGIAAEATPTRVTSGDVINGYMFDTCGSGTLSCPTWDIVTLDVTSGKFSEMINTSSDGQTFNWAFAGALEVYNIVQCSDYPSNGSISFYNVALYNDQFAKIGSPNWSVTNSSSGLTPQCSYGGSLPEQLNLTF